MEHQYPSQLTAFNQAVEEMNDIYHNYAKSCGLSDSVFWVLYSLWGNSRVRSQRELCMEWFYSLQTVNSTLKGLKRRIYSS